MARTKRSELLRTNRLPLAQPIKPIAQNGKTDLNLGQSRQPHSTKPSSTQNCATSASSTPGSKRRVKGFRCDHCVSGCNFISQSITEKNDHLTKCKYARERPYLCDIGSCQLSFAKYGELNDHIKRDHSDKNKKHPQKDGETIETSVTSVIRCELSNENDRSNPGDGNEDSSQNEKAKQRDESCDASMYESDPDDTLNDSAPGVAPLIINGNGASTQKDDTIAISLQTTKHDMFELPPGDDNEDEMLDIWNQSEDEEERIESKGPRLATPEVLMLLGPSDDESSPEDASPPTPNSSSMIDSGTKVSDHEERKKEKAEKKKKEREEKKREKDRKKKEKEEKKKEKERKKKEKEAEEMREAKKILKTKEKKREKGSKEKNKQKDAKGKDGSSKKKIAKGEGKKKKEENHVSPRSIKKKNLEKPSTIQKKRGRKRAQLVGA